MPCCCFLLPLCAFVRWCHCVVWCFNLYCCRWTVSQCHRHYVSFILFREIQIIISYYVRQYYSALLLNVSTNANNCCCCEFARCSALLLQVTTSTCALKCMCASERSLCKHVCNYVLHVAFIWQHCHHRLM